MIRGIDVTLYRKQQTGEDAFGAPVFNEVSETVHNVLIGENDMYTDFGMILTDLSLEMPEVKTKYQELPLENGIIDLSEVVTGRPVYGLRTLKLTFKRRGASASEWLSVCSQIASAVHGKRLPITLPDDPDTHCGRRCSGCSG